MRKKSLGLLDIVKCLSVALIKARSECYLFWYDEAQIVQDPPTDKFKSFVP